MSSSIHVKDQDKRNLTFLKNKIMGVQTTGRGIMGNLGHIKVSNIIWVILIVPLTLLLIYSLDDGHQYKTDYFEVKSIEQLNDLSKLESNKIKNIVIESNLIDTDKSIDNIRQLYQSNHRIIIVGNDSINIINDIVDLEYDVNIPRTLSLTEDEERSYLKQGYNEVQEGTLIGTLLYKLDGFEVLNHIYVSDQSDENIVDSALQHSFQIDYTSHVPKSEALTGNYKLAKINSQTFSNERFHVTNTQRIATYGDNPINAGSSWLAYNSSYIEINMNKTSDGRQGTLGEVEIVVTTSQDSGAKITGNYGPKTSSNSVRKLSLAGATVELEGRWRVNVLDGGHASSFTATNFKPVSLLGTRRWISSQAKLGSCFEYYQPSSILYIRTSVVIYSRLGTGDPSWGVIPFSGLQVCIDN